METGDIRTHWCMCAHVCVRAGVSVCGVTLRIQQVLRNNEQRTQQTNRQHVLIHIVLCLLFACYYSPLTIHVLTIA